MANLAFATFCSGIGSPECAWTRLGWVPLFCSEIEPFPSAVLAHRYPHTPNLGDMTRIDHEEIKGRFAGVDVVCAGTPCQSFSVAGLRKGMADPRGNLALVFLGLVDILRPRWVVWENVDGVRSSGGGRDFGSFLGALGELGYGWAYRVLDAQYGGVPQRRRRVFVVGHLGDWRRAAAVLLERESLCGNPPPRREAGARIAATLTRGADSSGRGGYAGRRREGDFNLVRGVEAFGGNNTGGPIEIAASLAAHAGPHGRQDFASETFLVEPASVAYQCHGNNVGPMGTLRQGNGGLTGGVPFVAGYISARAIRNSDTCNEIGIKDGKVSDTLQSDGPGAIAFDTTQLTSPGNYSNPKPGDPCHPLAAEAHAPAIAFQERGRKGGRSIEHQEEIAYAQQARAGGGATDRFHVMTPTMAVRRLTPTECERLMGFPDGHTAIAFNGKPASDGPRYRALGNSMVVNELEWIGRRVEAVESLAKGGAA